MDIRNNAIQSLDELSDSFNQLTASDYEQPLDILHGNSIGKHVRHVIEFFECLELGNSSLEVNYDNRKRNLNLETNPEYAKVRIHEIQNAIVDYLEKDLTLVVDYGYGLQSVKTSVYRELVYNIEHCVHHLAILKIGMESCFQHVDVDLKMGVAFSTLQFQKNA